MKQKNHSPLHGLWVVVLIQEKDHKDRWVRHKRYNFGDYTFDFNEESQKNDGHTRLGKMHERMTGEIDYINDYLFSTEDARLFISCLNPRFYMEYDTDIYRVRMVHGSMILYNTTEVEEKQYDIPDECWFRLILKRNTLKNRLIYKLIECMRSKKNISARAAEFGTDDGCCGSDVERF